MFVAYYRVSTQQQGRSGLGLEAQRAAVHRHCPTEPIAEYIEVESGKRDDRPQLAAAMAHAKAHDATLVIAKLDRLSRDVHFISGLLKQSIRIEACDVSTQDTFIWHIMASVAQKERELISERTRAAIAAKRRRGQPWGTNRERQRQADAYAASLATVIAEIRASGAENPSAIARALNARGIPTAKGKAWQCVQVQRLLARCDAVAGAQEAVKE